LMPCRIQVPPASMSRIAKMLRIVLIVEFMFLL
jgi:hypothetical protein